jgi:hypothetical protein
VKKGTFTTINLEESRGTNDGSGAGTDRA